MERIECKFAIDSVDGKSGEFGGYGAVFGNMDSHADVIAPGAFAETLLEWGKRGRFPSMKLMHGTMLNPFSGDDLPIGVWTSIREDATGLKAEGRLSGMDTDFGRRIYALVQDKALDGLSIGYKAKRFSRPPAPSPVKRILEAVSLGEISLVDNPSNDRSRISGIKSAEAIKTIREFEDFLRDAGGYSATQAKRIAASGFKSVEAMRDAGDGHGVGESIDRLLKTLTGAKP